MWRALTRRLAMSRATARLGGPLIPALVAAALGLYRIGDKSIWLDEAFSVAVARLPTSELLLYLWRSELHASPYYVALHPWLVLGEGEAQVRALSVVFGVVAVLATYAVGRRYGVAFPAALVLAVAPYFVQFEQEARGYTLLAAWSAISTLAYLRLIEQPGRLRGAVYLATAGAIIYVHPLGAFVVVAHGLMTLLRAAPPLRWRMMALFGLIAVAWLPMVRFAASHREKIAWIEPPTPLSVTQDLIALGGGALVAGALVILLAFGFRRDLTALWLLVPIAGTLLISLTIQPALQPKYLIGVLPAAAIIAARNRPVALVILIALSLVAVGDWYVNGTKDDWRSGAAWVEEQLEPGDGIAFASANMRLAFGYYAKIGEPVYAAIPWGEHYPFGQGAPLDLDAIAQKQRIWLVQGHGRDAPAALWQALEQFEVASSRDWGRSGPYIELLVRGPSP
jgi:mannosyltransferase